MGIHKPINSEADFEKAVSSTAKPFVLIFIHEGGEIPAQAEEAAKKNEDKIDPYSIDLSAHSGLKEKHGVTETPVLLLFKDGKEVHKVEGRNPEGFAKLGSIIDG